MADQGHGQEVVLVCKDFIMWTHNKQFRISLNSNKKFKKLKTALF